MMQIRPFQTYYNVIEASNANLNAWHGAKDFANSSNFEKYLTTKNDFLEYGGEYFKEHYASNKFCSTPILLEADSSNNESMKMDCQDQVDVM